MTTESEHEQHGLEREPEAQSKPTPQSEAPAPDSWEATLADLRKRFPEATEGTLFCIHKLLQDKEVRIPDFRAEAKLYGITIAGRAFHSARVALGLAQPSVRKPNRSKASHGEPEARPSEARPKETRRPTSPAARAPVTGAGLDNVEASLIHAVSQIQDAATADSRRLRAAMQQAVEILQRALDGRGADDQR